MYTLVCIHERFCSCISSYIGSPYVKASMSKIHLQVQFPHYLSAYQNEAIKVAAILGFWLPARDDFHSSKLANQTLGWPQLTLGQKRRQISPCELLDHGMT